MKKQLRRPQFRLYVAYGFLIIFASIGWYFSTVRTIVCTIANTECPPEVSAQLAQLMGQRLIGIDLLTQAEQVLAAEPLDIVGFKKKLPNTLQIQLSRIPYAYVLKQNETLHAVSTDGKLYSLSVVPNILTIETVRPISELIDAKNQLQTHLHQALQSLTEKAPTFTTVKKIELLDNDTLLFTMNNTVRVLLSTQKVNESLTALKYILEAPEYQKLQKEYTEIDLRFKLPVLRKTQ